MSDVGVRVGARGEEGRCAALTRRVDDRAPTDQPAHLAEPPRLARD